MFVGLRALYHFQLLTISAVHLLQCSAVSACHSRQHQQQHQQINSCKATFQGHGTLDLSPLDGVQSGQPYFKDFATVNIDNFNYKVSYNPCSGFACHGSTESASCANFYSLKRSYSLGRQNDTEFQGEPPGPIAIRYGSGDQRGQQGGGDQFSTLVSLVCNTSSEGHLTGVSMSADGMLSFQLSSRHCCLLPPPPGGSWSPGDVILLLFFTILALYVATFVLINWLWLKRSGWDLLPHRGLWLSLAALVKDGCGFTFATFHKKLLASKRGDYDQI